MLSFHHLVVFTQAETTMKKPKNAYLLAVDILGRSKCLVQVGAAIEDKHGIISWGWNFDGLDGLGCCAEAHAILRANKKRLHGATIYVASLRQRNMKIVKSKPCDKCQQLIKKWNLRAVWRDATGDWVYEGR